MSNFKHPSWLTRKNIEWAIGLIRPKFHNRVTWAVLLTGFALTLSPAWEPYLRSVLTYLLDIKVDPPESSLWGIALILAALVYSAAVTWLDQRRDTRAEDSAREHDKELAYRFRETLPENDAMHFLGVLGGGHAYYSSQIEPFYNAFSFLASAEAHFLDQEVCEHATSLQTAISKFLRFVDEQFDAFPYHQKGGDLRCAMQPHLNIDRGTPTADQMREYDRLTDELNGYINGLRGAYRNLVWSFHERLHC